MTAYFGATEITDTQPLADDAGVAATRYYTFGSTTIGYVTDQGDLWWLLADVQGSATVAVRGDTTLSTAEIQRVAYTPYGQTRGTGELSDTDRGWLGQIEDATTGLSYLNARYYDASIGRFLSPDPLLNASDPRMLDAYMYANNNPIEYTDASGLEPHPWDDGRVAGVPRVGSGSSASATSGSNFSSTTGGRKGNYSAKHSNTPATQNTGTADSIGMSGRGERTGDNLT